MFGACRYLVLKNMKEAEYVADYLLGNGKKEDSQGELLPSADLTNPFSGNANGLTTELSWLCGVTKV